MGRRRKSSSFLMSVSKFPEDDLHVLNESTILCNLCRFRLKGRTEARVLHHLNSKMHVAKKRRRDKNDAFKHIYAVEQNMLEEEEEIISMEGGDLLQQHQQYCLKWNNHQRNMLGSFSRLLDSEQFTDVLLAAEGHTVRAHKMVLSASSAYFEQVFTAFNEPKQIVILKDTAFGDLCAIIEFMYKGEINVAQDQLPSLLRTAQNLQVKGLADVTNENGGTSDRVISTITPTTTKPATATSSSSINPAVQTTPLEPKRKRGRPRILDSPGDNPDQIKNSSPKKSKSSNFNNNSPSMKPSSSSSSSIVIRKTEFSEDEIRSFRNALNVPTPGGPLTPDRVPSLGIIKMNDYLASGTRQQFWDEFYVKVVMQAVKNKELDMKRAAEHLGVSYGTLYGRYRETFGYLKHGWNAAASKLAKSLCGVVEEGGEMDEDQILDQITNGNLSLKQAAGFLDPALLAYHMALKSSMQQQDNSSDPDEENKRQSPSSEINNPSTSNSISQLNPISHQEEDNNDEPLNLEKVNKVKNGVKMHD